MSDVFDKQCGDCFWYMNEAMHGNNQFQGGLLGGECHGCAPTAGVGWPIVAPETIGCSHWKQGGSDKKVIGPSKPKPKSEAKKPATKTPPVKEKPCPSTNTSANVGKGSTISQKPGDDWVPLSPADVGKKLSESPVVLDSPSGGPSTRINPTEIRP